jgi:hypothetical protein
MRHMLRGWFVLCAAVLLVAASAPPATADPIRIEQGFFLAAPDFAMNLGWFAPPTDVFGGLNEVHLRLFDNSSTPPMPALGTPIAAGETLPPTRTITGSGRLFTPNPEESFVAPQASFAFTGPLFTIPASFPPGPPDDEDIAFLKQPFSMTGSFSFDRGGTLTTMDVSGAGTAFLGVAPNRSRAGGARVESLLYAFSPSAPVPEPATLVLLGIGVAALVGRRVFAGAD